MPTTHILAWSGARCEPVKDVEESHIDNVQLSNATYLAGQIIGELVGVKAQETLDTTGTVSGGTFTITVGGQTTAAIAFNADAATVRAALELISTVGVGGILPITGTLAGDNMLITFTTPGAKTVTVDSALITGGGSIGITHTTVGTAGTPGTYAAYDIDGLLGAQYPTHILEYGFVVSGGLYYLGDTASSEHLQSYKYAPAWRGGLFDCADLVGFDVNAMTLMNARLIGGDVDTGRVLIPGT